MRGRRRGWVQGFTGFVIQGFWAAARAPGASVLRQSPCSKTAKPRSRSLDPLRGPFSAIRALPHDVRTVIPVAGDGLLSNSEVNFGDGLLNGLVFAWKTRSLRSKCQVRCHHPAQPSERSCGLLEGFFAHCMKTGFFEGPLSAARALPVAVFRGYHAAQWAWFGRTSRFSRFASVAQGSHGTLVALLFGSAGPLPLLRAEVRSVGGHAWVLAHF